MLQRTDVPFGSQLVQHKYVILMVVEKVVIDRDNNVDITLAIPIDNGSSDPHSPEPESVAIASKEPS